MPQGIDSLRPFLFDDMPVRGGVVRVGAGWAGLLRHVDYPPAVRDLLGRALAAAPLLASGIKFEGRLNIQFQGDGPISLLVVQVTHDLETRGMARFQGCPQAGGLGMLLGHGQLSFTVEPVRIGGRRYQAVVALQGDSLEATMSGYFEHSEQLPTRFWLEADGERIGGLMLQRLPGETDERDAQDEHWQRVLHLAGTITRDELLTLADTTLLRRLFHEEAVRVFDARPITVACRCMQGRISQMLLGLGREEVEQILAEQGRVEVECGFCGRVAVYREGDVQQLFEAAEATPDSDRRH